LPCPLCGLTRGLCALMKGQVTEGGRVQRADSAGAGDAAGAVLAGGVDGSLVVGWGGGVRGVWGVAGGVGSSLQRYNATLESASNDAEG